MLERGQSDDIVSAHLTAEIARISDHVDLKDDWTKLEESADCTFFNSWAWTATWLTLLPPDERPFVCRIRARDKTIAIGLLGCARRRRFGVPFRQVFLNASGNAFHDSIHTEMNRLLAAPADEMPCVSALFDAVMAGKQVSCDEFLLPALSQGDPYRDVAVSRGLLAYTTNRPAPFVDLARLRATRQVYVDVLAKKVRYAIRRARSDYSNALGPPKLTRARTVEEALEYLRGLAVLHQRRWVAKGASGAFSVGQFKAFHDSLVAKFFHEGNIDLFRIHCEDVVVGFVYVLRYRHAAAFYQCGFDYGLLPAHNQPGFLALPMIINYYHAIETIKTFEFLGGDEQYKRRFSTSSRILSWLEIHRRGIGRTTLLRLYRRLVHSASALPAYCGAIAAWAN